MQKKTFNESLKYKYILLVQEKAFVNRAKMIFLGLQFLIALSKKIPIFLNHRLMYTFKLL